MDQEYKEMLYGAMFDELDRLQADKLYTDAELQKVALNVGGLARGVRRGFQSLTQNPSGFWVNIRKAYQSKAPAGLQGVLPRVGRVLKTDEGKLLAAGVGGAATLGAAGSIMNRRRQPQVVVQQ